MNNEQKEALLKKFNPILAQVMRDLDNWLVSPIGFISEPTKKASTEKKATTFDYRDQKKLLCNLQIKTKDYIQFGFKENQFKSLRLYDELKETIKKARQLLPDIPKESKGETSDSLKIFFFPPDKDKVEHLKNILEPLLEKTLQKKIPNPILDKGKINMVDNGDIPNYNLPEGWDSCDLKPDKDQQNSNSLYNEGTRVDVVQTRYERKPKAREACLTVKGYDCSVCGMNFEKFYGDIGRNFIHVHHNQPISSIPGEHQIDPVKDLDPVCPNCHAMLHACNPPFSTAEMRKRLHWKQNEAEGNRAKDLIEH